LIGSIHDVQPEDALLRRVADAPAMWTRADDGTVRPTSAAMKPHDADAGLSVDIRCLLDDPGDPLVAINGFPGYGLAELEARVPFDLDLAVIHEPLDDNAAHANIVGFERLSKSQAKRVQRELAKAAAWICMPAGALGA
jgi:hypothetical protein